MQATYYPSCGVVPAVRAAEAVQPVLRLDVGFGQSGRALVAANGHSITPEVRIQGQSRGRDIAGRPATAARQALLNLFKQWPRLRSPGQGGEHAGLDGAPGRVDGPGTAAAGIPAGDFRTARAGTGIQRRATTAPAWACAGPVGGRAERRQPCRITDRVGRWQPWHGWWLPLGPYRAREKRRHGG